jgi:hypothetical protein
VLFRSLLKKVAFKKEPGNDDELTLQMRALAAIGAYAQSKYIDSIAEQTKQRNQKLAEAAYLSFSNYGIAKGKVRKKVAEALMKRLESEYPSASADKNPGEAAKKRWAALQMPIVRAMQAVCHEPTINDIANWREWWKENKKNAKAWKDPKPPKPA